MRPARLPGMLQVAFYGLLLTDVQAVRPERDDLYGLASHRAGDPPDALDYRHIRAATAGVRPSSAGRMRRSAGARLRWRAVFTTHRCTGSRRP